MTTDSARSKLRWGDLNEADDDSGEDLGFFLPPPVVVGPDENGLNLSIEYNINDKGERVKVTTVTRVRKLARARLSKRAIGRRSWAKFGDAAKDEAGRRLTMASTEEIGIERPGQIGTRAEVPKPKVDGELIMCRICNMRGAHWTARCPYKDLVPPQAGSKDDKPLGIATVLNQNSYVPPRMRDGGSQAGPEMRRRNDENSVRVSNLSEDTYEPDLLELFRVFGNVTRVYVSVDQRTGVSRGFGFVNFVHREDAERAINKLNGYGYDNLILRVEWAAPRAN